MLTFCFVYVYAWPNSLVHVCVGERERESTSDLVLETGRTASKLKFFLKASNICDGLIVIS